MHISKIHTIFFSPTGTTKTVASHLAAKLSNELKAEIVEHDITYPSGRNSELNFKTEDLVIIGFPVYAGRIPNLLLKVFEKIKGSNTPCIPIVLYGNRAFDDALRELSDLMEERGFRSVAAGAFVGQHSFSNTLAAGRPDKMDLKEVELFGEKVFSKLFLSNQNNLDLALKIPGKSKEERAYFQPKSKTGSKINILKVIPQTSESCTKCGTCVSHCPMGSIDASNPSLIIGPCIKCNACVRLCPVGAKSFTDEGYLIHLRDLEERCARRGENNTFV